MEFTCTWSCRMLACLLVQSSLFVLTLLSNPTKHARGIHGACNRGAPQDSMPHKSGVLNTFHYGISRILLVHAPCNGTGCHARRTSTAARNL